MKTEISNYPAYVIVDADGDILSGRCLPKDHDVTGGVTVSYPSGCRHVPMTAEDYEALNKKIIDFGPHNFRYDAASGTFVRKPE